MNFFTDVFGKINKISYTKFDTSQKHGQRFYIPENSK